MSIFSRLFKIGQAKANQIVDGLEKPEVMLDQAIRDKEKQIIDLRNAVAGCIATEKRTKALLERELQDKDNWESKAETALRAGREDLAAKALERSSEHEQKAVGLQQNWEVQKNEVEKLKIDLQKEQDRLAEYKRNRDFLVAQSKFADAKKNINQARAKMGSKSADNLMDRMKAKVERQSYEADAVAELANSGSSLEKEFDSLGETTNNAAIDSKLAEMKARLAQS